jgi:hypothetical protein
VKRLLLIAREKKTGVLIALAALTIAVFAAIGSGAWFTASTLTPGLDISAGNMQVTQEASDTAVLTVANMFPGDAQIGDVTVNNPNGPDHAALLQMEAASTTDSDDALDADLLLRVTDDSGNELYDGSLQGAIDTAAGGFLTDSVAIDAEGSTTLHVQVYMPDSGDATDDVFQGVTSKVNFRWILASVPKNDAEPKP